MTGVDMFADAPERQSVSYAVRVSDGKKAGQWVKFNPLTVTYDTPDGTSVAAELVDNAQYLVDVLHIAAIRAKQRAERS